MEDLKQQIKEGRKGVIELKKRNKKSDKEKERKVKVYRGKIKKPLKRKKMDILKY